MLISLNRVRAADVSLAGGKGANLGELIAAGFPVPDGFCITAEAYRSAVAPLQADLTALLEAGDPEAVRALVADAPLPDGLEAGVLTALKDLGQGPVAVRSSATAEDLPEASFAGQQETFLGVTGDTDVLSAVRRCWASLWTDRAIAYRAERGFAHDVVRLAVVVQSMVAADSAGVAFTADPVTGRRDEVVIDAAWGLGESVVSGSVTPDSFTVRGGQVTRRSPGDKTTRIDLEPDGRTVTTTVADKERRALCLTDRDVLRIARLARDVEAHYGTPMDIEWAIAGGTLWLLQARPITTITGPDASPDTTAQSARRPGKQRPGRLRRFIRTDLIEHFPSPYPLDLLMVRLLVGIIRDVSGIAGIRLSPHDLVAMDDDGIARIAYPRVCLWGVPLGIFRVARLRKPDPRRWADGPGARMREAAARFAALAQENLSDEALAGVFTEAVREAGAWARFRFVEYLVPNALRGGWLDVWLRLARVKATQFDLLGDLDYATMIIDRRLHALADSAPERVRELLCAQEIDAEAVREADPTWWRAVEDFLADYGARTTRMYQPFSSTAWREDLPGFLRVVAMMDHADGRPSAARSTHEQLVTKTVLRLPRFLRRRFLRLVDDYRAGYVMREASVVDTEEFCAALRALALEAGRRMSQAGLIPAPGDVKFLTEDELLAWLRGSAVDVAGIVARRRWARPMAEAAWHEGRESEDGDTASGVAASPGRVTGPARIITGPDDFPRLQAGDVLVCRATDPAWTPLFALAAGVVAETGGRLSHAAIVAREYGIPAVLGIPGATSTLADGQPVTVDGTQGQVTVPNSESVN